MKAHQNGTKTFEELTYNEQSKSISAQILNLEAAINVNIRRAETEKRENPTEKRIKSILSMVERLKNQ
ncbi:MAG: hypothetical protein LBM77_09260 [Spirochaetaceae bacterium]|jgi:RNase adaptor protein for sRNA GlmZ degradation|nr:hypothetical protein [Spirochaetaceae bacterium]